MVLLATTLILVSNFDYILISLSSAILFFQVLEKLWTINQFNIFTVALFKFPFVCCSFRVMTKRRAWLAQRCLCPGWRTHWCRPAWWPFWVNGVAAYTSSCCALKLARTMRRGPVPVTTTHSTPSCRICAAAVMAPWPSLPRCLGRLTLIRTPCDKVRPCWIKLIYSQVNTHLQLVL